MNESKNTRAAPVLHLFSIFPADKQELENGEPWMQTRFEDPPPKNYVQIKQLFLR